MEQHEQRACFNLIGLRDAAECLRKGGQVARELRADAAVGKQGALLQEAFVQGVGGGGAKAECLHERFRVQAARTVESFRCGERNAGFFVEVADHGIAHVGSLQTKPFGFYVQKETTKSPHSRHRPNLTLGTLWLTANPWCIMAHMMLY